MENDNILLNNDEKTIENSSYDNINLNDSSHSILSTSELEEE
tara:strand:- start:801 stop:926 length:126 start_codon:yes stop_codon:yes gene_type:complete